MRLKRLTLVLILVCTMGAFATTAMAGQTPMDRIKEGTDKLIAILSNPDFQDPAKHDTAIASLRATAEEYIDFRLVTMYSVGRSWLKMSKRMQDDLVEAFIQLLERSYLQKIPAYGGQKVHYLKEQVAGKKAKVFTEIIDKDKKVGVEFRLRNTGKAWMIYDVVAEGVSLVSNYRTQFSEILSDGTAEDLLKAIRERIDKLNKGEGDDSTDNAQG